MKHNFKYLTGLKGFACIWVMMGHYCTLYTYSNNVEPIENRLLELTRTTRLSLFFNAPTYWLYLFFVISGYLVCDSVGERDYTISQCIKKSVIRFLRFLIPMTGACVMIYICWCVFGGWHYNQICSLSENPWISQYYSWDVDIVDVFMDSIRTMLLGSSKFNPMWWCMRNIYCISLGVYAVVYCGRKLNDIMTIKVLGLDCLFVVIVVCVLIRTNQLSILAGLSGALAHKINEALAENGRMVRKISGYRVVSISAIVFTLLIGFISHDKLVWIVCFDVAIITMLYNDWFQRLFENKLFAFLGNISFGIYSFHVPILYIFGGPIFYRLHNNVQNQFMFLTGYIICCVITILLAKVFNIVVEQPSAKLIRNIKTKMDNL